MRSKLIKHFFLTSILLCTALFLQAQDAQSLINKLDTTNRLLTQMPCNTGEGMLISNKAMNLFLANKTGTYLSEGNDLSLYKNSVVFNAASGVLSINHNMYPDQNGDVSVKPFYTIGARSNAVNALISKLNNKAAVNDFGVTVKRTWIAKAKTFYNNCSSAKSQKQEMDAYRATLLFQLKAEIKQEAENFENGLAKLQPADMPGQNLDSVKMMMRKNFYQNLSDKYVRKFDEQQSETLINTNNYNLVATSWTSVYTYIPLMHERFIVAPGFTQNFKDEYSYPFELKINHTRFWESSKAGRFFLMLNANMSINNAATAQLLNEISSDEYRLNGGIDAARLTTLGIGQAYIGNYRNFVTPSTKVQLVYIPPDWHLGLTFMAEKNYGIYNALNGKIAVPIVLIDKKGDPAITFESQVLFFDMTNTIQPSKKFGDKISVGVTVGIPFSKVIY